MSYSLSIIIPALNEALNIKAAVASILSGLPSAVKEYEIIIVNDGSIDSTRDIINDLAAHNEKVVPVHHDQNAGKGASLVSGFRQARMDWVLFMDADQQIDITELGAFLHCSGEYEVIIGYRMDRKMDPLSRRLLSRGFSKLIAIALGVCVRDVNCPFKLFRRSVVEKVEFVTKGFLIDAEFLYRVGLSGINIKELGVACKPRLKGMSTVRFRHFFETLRELAVLVRSFDGRPRFE